MTRTNIFAALLTLVSPSLAAAQSGNASPAVDELTVPNPSPEQATTNIGCAGHDTDGIVTRIAVTVSGGLLPNATTSQDLPITQGASAAGVIVWYTPAAGSYSVTCTVYDNGGLFGGSASSSSTVTVNLIAGQAPVFSSLDAQPGTVLVGGSSQLSASAVDPGGGGLTWTWSATGGVISGSGAQVTWTAPTVAGSYRVRATATASNGLSAFGERLLTSVLAQAQGGLGQSILGPRRLAEGPEGFLYVVDGSGGFHVLTPRGDEMAVLPLSDSALAVAAAPGAVFISLLHGKVLKYSVAERRVLATFDTGYAQGPSGLAFDTVTGYLWMAERDAAQLRALRADGTTALVLQQAGTQALTGPSDVAIDTAARLVWVALDFNPNGQMAFAFHAATGAYLKAAQPGGSAPNQVNRAGGMAVDASGRLFISDAFAGRVQATSGSGQYLGPLGSFGTAPGELRQPAGVVAQANGNILVANSDNARLELYGSTPVPTCLGDSDCDGLPDAWELAYALNPHDAHDALADPDGDGLPNLAEYQRGTHPRMWDTDGDAYGDGEEVFGGFNPLDPADHKPTLLVAASSVSDPGLVQWTSTIQGRGTCSVTWTQTGGPSVLVRGGTTSAPGFVGREAASYVFAGVPKCDNVSGDPVPVEFEVRNVAPRVDPGRVTTVQVGQTFLLDGAFTRDANGDSLTFTWDQMLGPPRLGSSSAVTESVRAYRAGLYSFQLEARDNHGLSTAAEIPVMVVPGGRTAPTAMATTPELGTAGQTVGLDGSTSVGPRTEPLTYHWSQVSGPTVALSATDVAAPTFSPPVAGRYVFELWVMAGGIRSPSQRIEVYVGPAGGALPVATVAVVPPATAGEPLSLVGNATAASGGTLFYLWEQVSGPAAGLTQAYQPVANVVPFEAGTYVFALRVREGDAEALPALVHFDADAAGQVRPQASAVSDAAAYELDNVVLDATASTSWGSKPLRYRWTQVAGPWVALDDPTASVASFVPATAGLYTFELEVDDGQVRSAPSRTSVLVFSRQAQAGGR